MKRSLLGKKLKQTFLAVPAAAMMLGVADAGTTIGLNFQAWYYDSGTTPQTVGFGAGYQTTGFPVTGTAFGVASTNWWNTDPITCNSSTAGYATFNGATTFAGALTANITAANAWQTGIGALYDDWVSESVVPGNNEVTWGILDNTGWSINLAHLNSLFPNGYVVQAIAAGSGKITSSSQVFYSDSTTFTNGYGFNPIYSVSGATMGGYEPATQPVGTAISGTFTNDAITISSPDRATTNLNCAVAGFIFTDKPVITWMGANPTNAAPTTNSVLTGTGLTLSSSAIGIQPLSYQWQLNGTNIPGATSTNYVNASISAATAGNYQLIVTNLYGAVTSEVASVTVLAPTALTWTASVNNSWDINSTANWTSGGGAATYLDGSLVTFDDTAASTSVNVAATVAPYTMTVSNTTKAYTFGGSPISSLPGGLIKNGANTLTLSGANTFTGPISINGGTLNIADPGTLGGGIYSGSITNNGIFIWSSSAAQTNAAATSGTGALIVNGSGTLTLSANASLTNGVTVNSGTLQVTAGNFGGTFSPRVVINTNGTVLNNSTHSLGGGSAVFINHGTWVLNYEDYKQNLAMIDGFINVGPGGNGGAVRAGNSGGTGNWTWYISNSIAGSVINEKVEFNDVTVNSSLTFNVQRGAAASDLTINGAMNGGAGTGNAFIFTGNGITTLNGAGTGIAGTTVNGGTVIVNSATSGGTTTVGANGTMLVAPYVTLNGSASIGGTFALIPAGGIGQVYVGGDLTMIAGGNTIMKISKNGGALTADNLYANILSGTGVTYGGMLTVTNVTTDSTPLAVGDSFTLFSGLSYGGGFTSFNLPALPAGLSWDTSQLLVNGSITVSSTAPPPVFSPGSGNYIGAQTVAISSPASGATIYYTTDGSTPTSSSPHGTTPVTVNVPVNTASLTIKAYATAAGYSANSPVSSATYSTVATPTWINPAGGTWSTSANWSNGIIANASSLSADFGELTLPASPIVTLTTATTVGSLTFGDVGNTYGWVVAPNGGSSLILDNGTNIPVINVKNQSLTLTNVALAGANGLIKNGAGSLVLAGVASTYTSNTVVNGGALVLTRGGSSGTLTSTNITVNPGATLVTTVADALGYSGTQWVRIISLYGGLFTNAAAGNEGWGLTFNLMGGVINSGSGAIAAGSGTFVNTLSTNIASRIDGKIILREGNANEQVAFNVASGAASPDLLVNAAISQANGTHGISKSGAGVMSMTATNTYTGLTSVSGGTLLVTGSLASTNLVTGGKLMSNGKFTGPTTVQSGGTLQPGLGNGDTSSLILSNSLTLGGNVIITLNRTNAQNASAVTGITTLAYGGTLTVTNAGSALQLGDTFTVFSAASYTGNFSATNLPALTSGLGWSWSPASGTLSVVQPSSVNPNPTNIVVAVSSSTLTLSWPADHTGWYLQSATNLTNPNWVTVPNSQLINSTNITVDPTVPTVFYRLMYTP